MTKQIGARITSPDDIITFITGGKARFTLVSPKNGERFSFTTVDKSRDGSTTRVWFVYFRDNVRDLETHLLTGELFNEYIGALRCDPSGVYTVKQKEGVASRRAQRVFMWLCDRINERDFTACEFWHEGACCVCARPLTDEQSVLRGIGPVCEAKRDSMIRS